MQSHRLKVVRRTRSIETSKATLRTLTLLIPRSYNANGYGVRKPVELSKLISTLREIRHLFGGYVAQYTTGWYCDPNSGKGCRDSHFRFDIDLPVNPATLATLRRWKTILEERFEQQAIYMRLSERVFWL